MTDPPSIRIVIADDHPIARFGLSSMLAGIDTIEVIAEAEDGIQAISAYDEHLPDILLVDLRMPSADAVEVTRAVRKGHPGAKVIVMTAFDDEESTFRAFEAGAAAYLRKTEPKDAFVRTLHEVFDGSYTIPPEVGTRLAGRLAEPRLSPREIEVLGLVANGMSNKEVGAALGISASTAKNHVESILGKLGVSDRTRAVTLALERGILRLDR